jgi:glucose/arabinose dehydrogenase
MHNPLDHRIFVALAALVTVAACADDPLSTAPSDIVPAAARVSPTVKCDADNGDITLPEGFCAVVVADLTIGGVPAAARHLVVTPSGEIFVAINSPRNNQPAFGIVGLRDTTGDGKADEQSQFSPNLGGSGIAYRSGLLYFGANDRVLRFRLPSGRLTPIGSAETVVAGLVDTADHISKTLVLDSRSRLFVNIGSGSNACQVEDRTAQSPGIFPCPEFSYRAGIWTFDPTRSNQTLDDGQRYATGYRNMVALAVNPADGELYGVQHGRDMLFENWPQFFTVEEDAVLPAEEFVRITRESNNGWPYCYFDAVFENKKVLAPEYGGNGQLTTNGSTIDCATFNQPLATFGAHWAPNGMTFYTGKQFPAKYRGGVFVAFHGGFDRAPLPNEGYNVMFIPMSGGTPSGAPELFADGFAGSTGPLPATAVHRPVGVTEGPDGSLYVSDDRGGRIWRIVYIGG